MSDTPLAEIYDAGVRSAGNTSGAHEVGLQAVAHYVLAVQEREVARLREIGTIDEWTDHKRERLKAQTNAAPQDKTLLGVGPAVAAPHPVVAEMEAAEAFVKDYVERGKYDAAAENSLSWGYLWHGWALRDAFHAGAKYAREATAKQCEWRQDEDGNYHTGCGNLFFFDTGTAEENKAKFCQYCGGDLKAVSYIEPQDAAADRTDDKEGGP